MLRRCEHQRARHSLYMKQQQQQQQQQHKSHHDNFQVMSKMFRCFLIVILALSEGVLCVPAASQGNQEETADTWNAIGEEEIRRAESYEPLKHRAKNVILFLGDGMGISTVTAARILNGGEESLLSFERFPNTALSKTYCADHQVTDSAASSTAYQCGVKTNKGLLGLDPRVPRDNCNVSRLPAMQLTSILDWSLLEGKSVGLVTNTRITHATPGGAYANVAERDWEGDSELPDQVKRDGCRDIARQLVEDYPDVQVVMGGGRQFFLPQSDVDPNTNTPNTQHGRQDGRDLTREWQTQQQNKKRKAAYVWNAQQLRQLDLDNTDYLFGLFAQSHMDYEADRDHAVQPSLTEMTSAAIQILRRNPKGFYLLVEGGRIDHSHHNNIAFYALNETLAFADAIDVASTLTSDQETLTVVTADHSHTMILAGYQHRGNPIFNVADDTLDADGKQYTTLLYGTGPGYRYNQTSRANLTNQQTNVWNYTQESSVPMSSSSHAGEDVAIYAKGPMSHLFHAVHEENYIAHLMAYASCVGRYKNSNKCPPLSPADDTGASEAVGVKIWLVVACVLMAVSQVVSL